MTIIPAIVFVAASALAIVFEAAYWLLDRKVYLSVEKGLWALLWWVTIGILGTACGVLSVNPPIVRNSVPLFFVAFVHVFMALFHEHAIEFRTRPGSGTVGGGRARNAGGRTQATSTGASVDDNDK